MEIESFGYYDTKQAKSLFYFHFDPSSRTNSKSKKEKKAAKRDVRC